MAHRTFVDRIGMTWEVWDVRPNHTHATPVLPGVPTEGWLCFQSGSTRKRLLPIPASWDTVADSQLLQYWRLATPVPSRNSARAAADNEGADAPHARLAQIPTSLS